MPLLPEDTAVPVPQLLLVTLLHTVTAPPSLPAPPPPPTPTATAALPEIAFA